MGSHTCRLLVNQGYKVIVLKRQNSDISKVSDIQSQLELIDIGKQSLQYVFDEYKIDHTIHMATAYGRDNDLHRVYETNVNFATQLLNLSLNYGVEKFINTDTFSSKSKNLDYLLAYHKTKRQFYDWGKFLTEKTGTEFITFFLQHPYGPDDNQDKFVSFILKSLTSEVDKIDLTDGLQKRDFIHVSDVANAYLKVIEASFLEDFEFEIGTGESISIKNFILKVRDITNNYNTKLNFGALPTRKNEIMDSKVDLDPMKKLGWKVEKSLQNGLEEMVSLYKKTS